MVEGLSRGVGRLKRILAPIRLWDWWEFKTPVFVAVALLTATTTGLPFALLGPRLLLVVAALVPVASYVCVINEITDRDLDHRAGKTNTMAARSTTYQVLWVLACLAGGALAIAALAGHPPAAALYAANWLAFTLYSVPPLRLKLRGLWGVGADACGGQLLPSLWSALSIGHAPAGALPPGLTAVVAAWALALGLRGILGHQVRDLDADRRADAGTFVARYGAGPTRALVQALVLPAERLAFAAMALLSGAWVVLALRLWSLLGLTLRGHRGGPARPPDPFSSGFRFYLTLFPLGAVLQLGLRQPAALLLAPLLVVLFPGCWGISPASLLAAAQSRSSPTPERQEILSTESPGQP